MNENTFINSSCRRSIDNLLRCYSTRFSHPEAEVMASEVLYQGLHFSKYDTLVSVLENEFEIELPSPLPEKTGTNAFEEQGCAKRFR